MDKVKKEKVKYVNYCCYNPEVGEGFYLITEDEQVEIIKHVLLEDIKAFKGNFKGICQPGVTGHSYYVTIKTPGKSLKKALKGSPYLEDSKKTEPMTMEEYKKYQDMYYNIQGTPSRLIEDIIKPLQNKKIYSSLLGQIFYTKKQRDAIIKILTTVNSILGINISKYWEYTLIFNYYILTDKFHMKHLHRVWKKDNLSQNQIGLLGSVKNELYKTKEDLISDLKERGFTEKEIRAINSCCVFEIDRSPIEEKNVNLRDVNNNFMNFGGLYNSLFQEKVEVGGFGNKVKKSNIKDCLGGHVAECNFYMFEDVIHRILNKSKKFYISITYTRHEDTNYKELQEKKSTSLLTYVWDLNKLWEITKV